MSTVYLNSGTKYRPIDSKDLNKKDILPIRTYIVKYDPDKGTYFLEEATDFKAEGKLYGDVEQKAERIMNTFQSRSNSTGVLLAGEKGSGKTMLAKSISIKGRDQGVVTLIVNSPYKGEKFNKFIQSIQQPAIIIFDEFEKVYNDREDQEAILTLLDGIFPSKKMFVMTVNESSCVNTYMIDRPGRLFYSLRYEGLDENFIKEYLEDNIKNKDHLEEAVEFLLSLHKVNFDMMKALVEEVNRYDESPLKSVQMLNIDSDKVKQTAWKVRIFENGKEITKDTSVGKRGKIIKKIDDMDDWTFYHSWYNEGEGWKEKEVEITADHLIEYDGETKSHVFLNGDYLLEATPWKEGKEGKKTVKRMKFEIPRQG